MDLTDELKSAKDILRVLTGNMSVHHNLSTENTEYVPPANTGDHGCKCTDGKLEDRILMYVRSSIERAAKNKSP